MENTSIKDRKVWINWKASAENQPVGHKAGSSLSLSIVWSMNLAYTYNAI